jgi:hypothetical protein
MPKRISRTRTNQRAGKFCAKQGEHARERARAGTVHAENDKGATPQASHH